MAAGFRTIFWGIFFITFHINFGPVAILPVFVGYIIVFRGIDLLQEGFASPNFQKARYMSLLLTLLGFISFLLIWRPQSGSIAMTYYPLLFSVFELFLIYFILEGSIESFISSGRGKQAEDYRSEQKAYIIFMMIYIIGMCLAITFVAESFTFAMLVTGMILRLWLLLMLGRLKRTQQ